MNKISENGKDGEHGYLGGYNEWELVKHFFEKMQIPEEASQKISKCYMDCVQLPYHNKEDLKRKGITKELVVNNHGEVFFEGKQLTSEYDKFDYAFVTIRGLKLKVYRLIAEVFCENPDAQAYDTVHHISGSRRDNNSNNLMFMTSSQHKHFHEFVDKIRESYDDNIDEIIRSLDAGELLIKPDIP